MCPTDAVRPLLARPKTLIEEQSQLEVVVFKPCPKSNTGLVHRKNARVCKGSKEGKNVGNDQRSTRGLGKIAFQILMKGLGCGSSRGTLGSISPCKVHEIKA